MSSLFEQVVLMKTVNEKISFVLKANALLSDENRKLFEAKMVIEEEKDNMFNELQIITQRCTNQGLQLDRLSDMQIDLRLSRIEVRELRKYVKY